MLLHNMFVKPVDRQIEGVIKADETSSLRTEIEEYVITRVISKELSAFFDDYLHASVVNGVWLSGFFGSGKSHLLKMLALLLENRAIDDTTTLDLFLPKLSDDAILKAEMEKVCKIPTKSILFNIAQKANVINQDKDDALVSVFIKVFNEMCGYFGNQPYIAQFERDLDKRGQYDDFKVAFENIAGISWSQGREQSAFEKNNIAKAYSEVAGDETAGDGILDSYRTHHKLSIDDFANDVKEYIDKQEKGFRLVFFVDEAGQFIANNVKLMLSLQTIAESLATKCKGKSWVIVTAQEDLNTILGSMKGHDAEFSRIQARFKRRIKLTSANVDEVIQRRLLEKTEQGRNLLSDIYVNQVNNLKTLFDFPDGAKIYKNYQHRENFVNCYPFVPYQFTLFQSSIQNLSKHEAFEGKHSSVGERSMLGVFQIVAMQIKEGSIGDLATFDMMFEGVRSSVKSTVQWGVTQAEGQLEDSFTIQILKALFLVKYVPEFHASVRNLSVLMIESFDQDLVKLRHRVEQSLNDLEQQTYIKRNENLYEYLTDEERDVEASIKSTDIDTSEIDQQLETILFDSVLKNKKIRYPGTGTDYPFTRKIDKVSFGKEYELAIDFIISSDIEADNRVLSMEKDELVVVLPPDDRFYKEAQLYRQTEKYVSHTISATQKEELKRILQSKVQQNQERLDSLKRIAVELIGQSKMYVAGDDVDGSASEPQARISNGFYKLIERIYPNLTMLNEIQYSENEISKYLNSKDTLYGEELTILTESQKAVFAYIENNHNDTIRVKVRTLIETFEKKPYGWPIPAILCHVAMLQAYGKIEVRHDSNVLEGVPLEKALRNTATHANLYLDPQEVIDKKEVKNLKEFYEDLFDSPASAGEPKALIKEFQSTLHTYILNLNNLTSQVIQFPFLSALQPVITKLKELENKASSFYLKDLDEKKEEVLRVKEEVIDPIKSFMNSTRKIIYDEARKFLNEQKDNLSYLETDNVTTLNAIIQDDECYKGDSMLSAKEIHGLLKEQVETKVKQEIESVQEKIKKKEVELYGMSEFTSLSQEKQTLYKRKFQEKISFIGNLSKIAMIRDNLSIFDRNTYISWVNEVAALSTQTKEKETVTVSPNPQPPVKNPAPTIISRGAIKFAHKKNRLSSQEDVDEYLNELKVALLEEINNGKQILL